MSMAPKTRNLNLDFLRGSAPGRPPLSPASPAALVEHQQEATVKFRNAIRRGRPVEPPPGAGFAHEHVAPDGTRVVVLRDQKGRLMPGNRLHLLRDGESGVEARNRVSVERAALGLPSPWVELRRRRKGGSQ